MKIENERRLRDLVGNNVLLNQTSLVEDLLSNGTYSYEDIENTLRPCEECEMCEYATEHNGEYNSETGLYDDDFGNALRNEDGEDILCENPEYCEIYEWWSVSDWLLRQLVKHGEPILKTDHGDYWGRTCTGQAIYLDYVIERIFDL